MVQLGDNPTHDDVKAFTEATLASGKVVPGFGHAVLRKTVRLVRRPMLAVSSFLTQGLLAQNLAPPPETFPAFCKSRAEHLASRQGGET